MCSYLYAVVSEAFYSSYNFVCLAEFKSSLKCNWKMCIIPCSIQKQIVWTEIADAGDLLNTLQPTSQIKLVKERGEHQMVQQQTIQCFVFDLDFNVGYFNKTVSLYGHKKWKNTNDSISQDHCLSLSQEISVISSFLMKTK